MCAHADYREGFRVCAIELRRLVTGLRRRLASRDPGAVARHVYVGVAAASPFIGGNDPVLLPGLPLDIAARCKRQPDIGYHSLV